MHYFFISILVQLALVVHAIKTGRSSTWIFIILFFPLVGSLAYLIVELLPELTHSRTMRRAQRNLGQAIDPGRKLREAEERYSIAATVRNAADLAYEMLHYGQFESAKSLCLRNLSGLYADDSQLLLALAQAHFGLREFRDALACLDHLKEKNPQDTNEEGHLLYARCLQELGRESEAITELVALSKYYPGPEPACRLAQLYLAKGDRDQALALFRDVLQRGKRAGSHYRFLHEEWLKLAREQLRE